MRLIIGLLALFIVQLTVTVAGHSGHDEAGSHHHRRARKHSDDHDYEYTSEEEREEWLARRKHHRRKEEGGDHHISNELRIILGVRSLKESSELLHQLTGHRDKQDVFEFLRKCKGSRSFKTVVGFLKLMGTSPYVLKAFGVMKPLIGHDDFDGIFESLQKISGERDPHEIADYFMHVAHTTGVEGVKLEILKLTSGVGPAEFPKLLKELLPEIADA
ncbi:hypothetical protein PYW08_012172 [Mythimna loreyi]|uniref:Uncharacterized protein n=1 Tax=Mythimna loreyi TaxID=667449 RepID=A0ACC2Q197_9NEOP|nr:hypothetical protein PYW08_012172 [Mythimna loreyi]